MTDQVTNFKDLIEKQSIIDTNIQNKIYSVKILKYMTKNKHEYAVMDCRLKSECICPVSELPANHEEGSVIDVMIVQTKHVSDYILVSHTKAQNEQKKKKLFEHKTNNEAIKATVTKRITNGYLLDVEGFVGFIKTENEIPEKEIEVYIKHIPGKNSKYNKIMCVSKMRPEYGNKVEKCVIKQMNDFFVFVEIISNKKEGIIHINDLSCRKIKHPMEICKEGQEIEAAVVKSDGKQTILSVKKLFFLKMREFIKQHKEGDILDNLLITNVHKNGIDVEYNSYVSGFIPRSESAWRESPNLSAGDKIKAQILELNADKRKVILSIKRLTSNPLDEFIAKHPIGSSITFTVKNKTDYRVWGELDSVLVKIKNSDFDVIYPHSIELFNRVQLGDTITATIENIDTKRCLVNVSKIGTNNKTELEYKTYKCNVISVTDGGLLVSIDGNKAIGFINKNNLGKKNNVYLSSFKEGQEVEATLIAMGNGKKAPLLSIKSYEVKQTQDKIKEHNSSVTATFSEFL